MVQNLPKYQDVKDIEEVVGTFKELIARLSKNGTELTDLYLSAERKAARYALLSEVVVESVTSGILVIDARREITLANSAAKRLLGLSESVDVTGRDLSAVLRNSRDLEAIVDRTLKQGVNLSRQEVRVRKLNNTESVFGVSTSCLKTREGQPEAVVLVFTDLGDNITSDLALHRQEIERLLRESYRKGLLDAFGIVSDSIVSIEGALAEIGKDQPDARKLRQVADHLRRACDMMMLYGISLIGSSEKSESVDINHLISLIAGRKRKSRDKIQVSLSRDVPPVESVRKVLETGLELLLSGCLNDNAEKLLIKTETLQDGAVRITVDQIKSQCSGTGLSSVLPAHGALAREAAIMLLRSLPEDTHCIDVSSTDRSFNFSLTFLSPKQSGARSKSPKGGEIERPQRE